MFGIGAQEMLVIGLLCLVLFGPGKLPGMARDLGGFVSKARASVDEFKSELASGGVEAFSEDRDEDPHREAEESGEPQHRRPEEGRQHGGEDPGTRGPESSHGDGRVSGEDGGPEEDRRPGHEPTGTSGNAEAAMQRSREGHAFDDEGREGA